jgi:hypothetical protein
MCVALTERGDADGGTMIAAFVIRVVVDQACDVCDVVMMLFGLGPGIDQTRCEEQERYDKNPSKHGRLSVRSYAVCCVCSCYR